ncbi:MAG TPA: hypothetical protein VHK27_05330, partial [Gammaproteobacteria bacterium]|nr:hypothetical protein [Gammaproteobacteria bacterium]
LDRGDSSGVLLLSDDKHWNPTWSGRDPVVLLRDRLIKAGEMSLDDYKALDDEILERIETEIIRYAEESPEPDVAELEKYMLAEDDPWVYGGPG